jgi:SAM-dependent methyltransferase
MSDTPPGWVEGMSATYDELLVPAVFTPFAADLAARIARRGPAYVLELAAGTGVLTNAIAAALPEARINATDLSPAMVEVGASRAPRATWQPADAMDLPFDDASFDAVAAAFGVKFFPDKARAYGEVRRVLVDDGSLFATVWGALEAHDYQAATQAALDELFPDDPPRFLADVPHGYHDQATIAADLRAGGLELVSFDTVECVTRTSSVADLARGYCLGTPLRAQLEARGDLMATADAVARAVEARLGAGVVVGGMVAHVIEAEVGEAGVGEAEVGVGGHSARPHRPA